MTQIFGYKLQHIKSAITRNEIDSVKILLPKFDKNLVLDFILRGDHVNILSAIIEAGFDPRCDNNIAIRKAVWYGGIYITKFLLAHPNVDPTVDNFYVMEAAIKQSNSGILRLLLDDLRMDQAVKGCIVSAAIFGTPDIVEMLLADTRVDPSIKSNAAVKSAAIRCHRGIINLLLADPRVDSDEIRSTVDHFLAQEYW
jgi:hypothetical protein